VVKRIAVALTLALLLALLLGTVAAPAALSGRRVALTSLEAGVLARLNQIRVQHGLVPLRVSVPLTEAADAHSEQMAADGFFQHTSADGTAFWKRIGHWYGPRAHRFWSVGENLLWSSPQVGPAAALQVWLRSPEHRANVLSPTWREIGVSSVHAASAPGVFGGRAVTIITTDFGVRR
jgi:uncharacterized protein YkwD